MSKLVLSGLLMLAAACGSDYGDAASLSDYRAGCNDDCEFTDSCLAQPDPAALATCKQNCDTAYDNVSWLADGAVGVLLACQETQACGDPDCIELVELQDYQQTSLDACEAHLVRCENSSLCGNSLYPLISAGFAAALTACYEGPCPDVQTCVADAAQDFGFYGPQSDS